MNPAHEHAHSDWLGFRRQVDSTPKKPKRRATERREISSIDVINVNRERPSVRCVVLEKDSGELLRALQALQALGAWAVRNLETRSLKIPRQQLSQAEFARLASEDPEALSPLLGDETGLPASLLTFAAEAVALVRKPSEALLQACLGLLGHEKAYVREGAVYGLAPHVAIPFVSDALRRVADNDSDDDVRSVAEDALDD